MVYPLSSLTASLCRCLYVAFQSLSSGRGFSGKGRVSPPPISVDRFLPLRSIFFLMPLPLENFSSPKGCLSQRSFRCVLLTVLTGTETSFAFPPSSSLFSLLSRLCRFSRTSLPSLLCRRIPKPFPPGFLIVSYSVTYQRSSLPNSISAGRSSPSTSSRSFQAPHSVSLSRRNTVPIGSYPRHGSQIPSLTRTCARLFPARYLCIPFPASF